MRVRNKQPSTGKKLTKAQLRKIEKLRKKLAEQNERQLLMGCQLPNSIEIR